MKYTALVVILLVSVLLSTAHAVDPGPVTHTVTLEITIEDEEYIEGEIEIGLFGNDAPVTVANFLEYADSNSYDLVVFHRVIENFMIQSGGYDRDLNERQTNWPIINESYNGLSNLRGTVAMARTSDPNSATSQFFINHVDNLFLNPGGSDAGYCVFGRVTDGMDFVDTIAQIPTFYYSDLFRELPIIRVTINRVRVPQIYVATDGDDSTGDGSEGNPYATIQKGIDMAENWVPVILMPGVYTGPGNCDIDFNGKAITVRSLNSKNALNPSNNNIAVTVIDTQGSPGDPHRAFYFDSGEGSDSVIESITIAGGYAENGAGIYCKNSSPTIRNCIIVDNNAVSDGGGIYCENSSPVIKNCNIFDNHAGQYGGAICSTDSAPKIINSIIWNNTGPGIIHGPADVTFCDVQGGFPGLGNINNDPHFADPDNGNFYLKSQYWRWDRDTEQWVYDTVTSRCIDAGCSGSLVMYEPDDPWRINMGVYGGTGRASIARFWALRPDINNDNIVNFKDFAAIVSYWFMESHDLPGDFNRDGIVSYIDLTIFSNRWLDATVWYPTLPADFNKDGVVNFADFAYIASAWYLVAERPSADFHENQIVDSADLALFAQSWLHTKAEHPILPADLNNDNIVNFADFAYLARDWQKTPYQLPAELDLDENQTLDITDLAIFTNSWLDTELWYE